jgi:hypothetical protein
MTDDLRIYSEVMDKTKRKWEQEVVQPNYGDRYVSHTEIRENPDIISPAPSLKPA